MKGEAKKLIEFLDGSDKRFVIPVYQRNYDWRIDNCKQLFNDLINLIQSNKKTHFFGSIVSSRHLNDVIIIDGQQRITTISLFFIALINAMKNGLLQSHDPILCRKIENKYIVDEYRPDERKVRLKPFKEDCTAFDNLIYKEGDDYVQDSVVTINYRYIYKRIIEKQELTIDELYEAISKLEIIHIQLEIEHGDDPQLIFESLNSTGLGLTEADKIRNFILMGLEVDKQEAFYDNYWHKVEKKTNSQLDGYLRDYLTVKTGKIPTVKKVYLYFKEFINDNEIETEECLIDLLKYANIYKSIKDNDLGDFQSNAIIKRLELLDMTVAYPFLLSFLDCHRENYLSQVELSTVLSTIETFIFRRQMCGLPTNALNEIFATLHKDMLKRMTKESTYSSIMTYVLQNRMGQLLSFPKDDVFVQSLFTKNIYSMQFKNRAYLFERLENSSSKELNDVIGNLEKKILTVEHIMPQTLNDAWKRSLGVEFERIHDEWLHTLSNLTLTGYNPTYSNRAFEEKRNMEHGFAHSGLRLNKSIAQNKKWTEEELIKRKEELTELALKIWRYPSTNFIPIEKEDEVISINEDFIFKGRKIAFFNFMDTKYPVNDWAGAILEISKLFYLLDPNPIIKEMNDQSNVWFSNKSHSNAWRKVADELFICTGNDTQTKIRIIRNLLEKYKLEDDGVEFGLITSKNVDL